MCIVVVLIRGQIILNSFVFHFHAQHTTSGCWSLQINQGGASTVLRSLIWLGMVMYHNPGTPKFGYFYCGTGEKNLDIPFMF